MPTLTEIIRTALERENPAAIAERVDGAWSVTSAARLLERCENVALALREMGMQAGDRASIIAPNSVDWQVANMGILLAAGVVVPIFATQSIEHITFILENCEAKAIFVESEGAADELRALETALPPIVVFRSNGEDSLEALERRGARIRAEHPERVGSFEREIRGDDLAMLMYTSGTTGQPKGVMLTQANIATNVRDLFDTAFVGIERGVPVLSVLPFSHIYECTIFYGFLRAGVAVYLCRKPEELLADLSDIQPAAMTMVPRIFERVLAGITAKAQKGSALRGRLVHWAFATGREYARARTFGPPPKLSLRLQYAIAHKIVLGKLRSMLGLSKLHFFCSGSAALHVDTALTFMGADILILQGYGLTETSPVITANRVAMNRFGSVGQVIPNVEVRLAEDGEIWTKGPNVMQGYYRNEAATREALSEDGWFKTGDIGRLDADGFLFITDRKKELFKTSGGKYLSPARIETAIKRSVYIAQVVLIGDNRPHPCALIVPNWDLIRVRLDLPAQISASDMCQRDDCMAFIRKKVAENTADLAPYEQVRRIVILTRDLTIEDGELSPTMKVKRRVVEAKYAPEIDRAYHEALPSPQ